MILNHDRKGKHELDVNKVIQWAMIFLIEYPLSFMFMYTYKIKINK